MNKKKWIILFLAALFLTLTGAANKAAAEEQKTNISSENEINQGEARSAETLVTAVIEASDGPDDPTATPSYAPDSGHPETGDSAQLILYIVVFAAGAALLSIIVYLRNEPS